MKMKIITDKVNKEIENQKQELITKRYEKISELALEAFLEKDQQVLTKRDFTVLTFLQRDVLTDEVINTYFYTNTEFLALPRKTRDVLNKLETKKDFNEDAYNQAKNIYSEYFKELKLLINTKYKEVQKEMNITDLEITKVNSIKTIMNDNFDVEDNEVSIEDIEKGILDSLRLK